ncbi:FeoA family protein [Sphingomonas quercus]|uniref:Ferrous iron transport protein A n=1 Tax=Sphingomonas quercus TaxID=2842451 RepID=A0ABS6BIG4_9SPHN|nr:ferrous iron transport protein A [Sphingomonas quercus]
MRLHQLPRNRLARIATVDWAALTTNEARRLRELGVDEGVEVMTLHQAPFGADPIAARIGRMTIAIRRATAAAIHTEEHHVSAVAAE